MDYAKLHHDVCFGKSNGKIIWQPRILSWIADRIHNGGQLPEPYTGMNNYELYRKLGCSNRLYEYNRCFKSYYPNNVSIENTSEGLISKKVIHTPKGDLITIRKGNTSNRGSMPVKWPIESKDDIKKYIWLHENTQWRFDLEAYNDIHSKCSDLGAPTIFIPSISIQHLYLNTMGIESGIYAIYDYPNEIEKYLESLHQSQMRMIDVINSSPIDIINFGDNIHCGTTPPELFLKYIMPYYNERCEKLHSANKFVASHWDGDTKALLPYAQDTGLDGIEAITPRPQGDVTLKEIKKYLGDNMFLLDGIPAILFDDIFSEKELIDTTHEIIDLFAPKLILGISDEISSNGDIERVRLVGQIVEEYNASL